MTKIYCGCVLNLTLIASVQKAEDIFFSQKYDIRDFMSKDPTSILSRTTIGPQAKRWRFPGGPIVARFYVLMPRSHINGLDARLATDTIRHDSWQSALVRSFPYCIRNHT